jgi:hypothetical protein
MNLGAIGQAVQSGQPAPAGRIDPRLLNDPKFQELAMQYGPEMAAKLMQNGRASTQQFVTNMNSIGSQQDPREQLMAMMNQAQM